MRVSQNQVCVPALTDAQPAAHGQRNQAAWGQIVVHLFPYGGFTGRNLMPILDGALGLLEETAADGQSIHQVLGNDVKGFCAALAGGLVSQGRRGPIAEKIQQEFFAIVNGAKPDRYGWLTPVEVRQPVTQ